MALEDGIVAYYKCDTDWSFLDASWNWNDWTIYWATYTSNWKINGAYEFDGSGDYVKISNSFQSVFDNNDFTISMWVYSNWTSSERFLWYEDDWGWDSDVWSELSIKNNEWKMSFDDGSSKKVMKEGSPNANQWYLLTMVHTEWTGYELYIDGSSIWTMSDNWNLYDSNNVVYIWHNGRSHYMEWTIDEIAIRNRAITSTEASELWNGWAGKQLFAEPTKAKGFFLSPY